MVIVGAVPASIIAWVTTFDVDVILTADNNKTTAGISGKVKHSFLLIRDILLLEFLIFYSSFVMVCNLYMVFPHISSSSFQIVSVPICVTQFL